MADPSTNRNVVVRDTWSNPASQLRYSEEWPDEPAIRAQYEDGEQCGGCAFFAPFNHDRGLCCCHSSRHVTETVFEHFTCADYDHEGWGPHSFLRREARERLDRLSGDRDP